MHQELDKLRDDHHHMAAQIRDCQKKLRELELKIGFEFGSDPMQVYRATRPGQ